MSFPAFKSVLEGYQFEKLHNYTIHIGLYRKWDNLLDPNETSSLNETYILSNA